MWIDLNCDVGELSDGGASDEAVMAFATSVSVACGFHAGDPATMRRTVNAAAAHRVAVGAHPGYPDREGFGRREQALAPAGIAAIVPCQIAAPDTFAPRARVRRPPPKLPRALSNPPPRPPPL